MIPHDDNDDDERDADHIEAVVRRGAISLVFAIFFAAFGLSGCATTVLTWLARKANTTEAGAPEWKETRAEMERILEDPEP